MIKQRKYLRYIVEGMGIYAKVFGAGIEVIDISAIDATIKSTTPFTIGREYSFKFEHKDRVISIKGVIAWENLIGSKKITENEIMPIYTAGVEFRDLAAETAEEIKKFIADKMAELRELRLSGVRVRIHPPEEGVVSYLETCGVMDISLGGMRIETAHKPSEDAIFPIELVIAEDESSIDCKGRVAFYAEVPEETEEQYNVGVEFIDMGHNDKLRLKKFLDTLHLNVEEM